MEMMVGRRSGLPFGEISVTFSGVEKHQLHRICSISEKEKPCYIPLMLQKSGDITMLRLVDSPMIYKVLYIPGVLFGISEPSTVSWNLDWLINKDPYNDQWKFNPQHSWTSCSSPIRTQTTRGPFFIAHLRFQKLHFPYTVHIRPEAHWRPFFLATPKRYFVDSRDGKFPSDTPEVYRWSPWGQRRIFEMCFF